MALSSSKIGTARVLYFLNAAEMFHETARAPGLSCILAGRLIGARTLWIDSMLFSTEMSRFGKLALSVATECWVQWEHLAQGNRPRYFGSVI